MKASLRTEKELEALLSLADREDAWQPTIVKTVATENKGIEELAAAIEQCREFQQSRPETSERRLAIARWRILELLREQLVTETLGGNGAAEKLERLAAEVASKQRDPYSAVEELMNVSSQWQLSVMSLEYRRTLTTDEHDQSQLDSTDN